MDISDTAPSLDHVRAQGDTMVTGPIKHQPGNVLLHGGQDCLNNISAGSGIIHVLAYPVGVSCSPQAASSKACLVGEPAEGKG